MSVTQDEIDKAIEGEALLRSCGRVPLSVWLKSNKWADYDTGYGIPLGKLSKQQREGLWGGYIKLAKTIQDALNAQGIGSETGESAYYMEQADLILDRGGTCRRAE